MPIVVIGAGFSGSVLADRLAGSGRKVIIIEKRDHVGGNCYDYLDENGILIHKYGPHIFHTNNDKVWEYLLQFTEWFPYTHRVMAKINNKYIPIPVNLNTIYDLFTEERAKLLEQKLKEYIGLGQKIPILELLNSGDNDIKDMADIVYKMIYLNYSVKQWGTSPDKLDPKVTGRVPVWTDRDNRYFKDKHQGIPKDGYTAIFKRMLDHPNIEIILNNDFKDVIGEIEHETLIYTGPIDYYFNYKYGELPYRSLRFEIESLDMEQFQDVAVVNYPGEEPFIRITEFKHFTGLKCARTVILREYPEEYVPKINIPFYPVLQNENLARYQKYQTEARKLKNVVFVGRLAEYKYYNMDESVERALNVFEGIVKE